MLETQLFQDRPLGEELSVPLGDHGETAPKAQVGDANLPEGVPLDQKADRVFGAQKEPTSVPPFCGWKHG